MLKEEFKQTKEEPIKTGDTVRYKDNRKIIQGGVDVLYKVFSIDGGFAILIAVNLLGKTTHTHIEDIIDEVDYPPMFKRIQLSLLEKV